MLECDLIKCQKALHAVRDVPATQSCSTDVLDVAVQFKRRLAGLTNKLSTPFLIGSSLATSAPMDGRLILAINDDNYGDNSGSFTVRVRY